MRRIWDGVRGWQEESTARPLLLTIRISKDERARAERVAKHHGSNVARVVRRFFVEEARRIDAEEREKEESLQTARKSAESREPRSPPGFRPTKSARKAGEARPPRAGKAKKRAKG
jgi:hypothetical protein